MLSVEEQKEREKIYSKVDERDYRYYLIPKEITGDEDLWVGSHQISKELSKYGLDFQSWCDLYLLGIPSISDRPKCANHECNNTAAFYRKHRRYRQFCCASCRLYSEDLLNKLQEGHLKAWKDPNSSYNRPDSYFNSKEKGEKISKSKLISNLIYRSNPENVEKELNYYNEHPELRNKLSINAKLRYQEYISDPKNVEAELEWMRTHPVNSHGGIYSSLIFNKEFKYDSSYELEFIKLLESINSIKEVIREPFLIDYIDSDSGTIHKYMPDFLIVTDKGKFIIEIKSSYGLTRQNTKDKLEYAVKYCNTNGYKYYILTESELNKNYLLNIL